MYEKLEAQGRPCPVGKQLSPANVQCTFLLWPGPAGAQIPKRLSLFIELRPRAPSVSYTPPPSPKPRATLKTQLPSKGRRVQFILV